MIEIQGNWRGEYTDQYNEKVGFEMYIDQHDDGFSGICIDLFDKKVKSKIKGFIEDDLISFTKKYDEPIIGDEHGSIFIDEEAYHPGVHYYGRFNFDKIIFEGSWEITTNEASLGNDESLIWFDYGSWWMEKIYVK